MRHNVKIFWQEAFLKIFLSHWLSEDSIPSAGPSLFGAERAREGRGYAREPLLFPALWFFNVLRPPG